MFNVSTSGASVVIKSTVSIPTAYPITHFADDQGPFEVDPKEITGYGMGLNNDLVVYAKPNVVLFRLSVIANSPDDLVLRVAHKTNQAGSPSHFADVFDATVVIPNIAVPQRYINGKIVSGPPGDSSSADGKNQSHQYMFVFEKEEL